MKNWLVVITKVNMPTRRENRLFPGAVGVATKGDDATTPPPVLFKIVLSYSK